ncbi:MAG TPA: PEGA domain-containing protein, partial [Tepidisphaeraceae bacterium]
MTRSTPASLTLICSFLLSGCVERQMTITSDPPNALVYLNGQEAGRTPIQRDYTWYGNYDVQVRADGHQTLKTEKQLTAPWWQWPPFDFFAELMPWHPTDRQAMHFTL